MQGHRRKAVMAAMGIAAGVLLVCGLAYVPFNDTTLLESAFAHVANFVITPVGEISDDIGLDEPRSVAIFEHNSRTYAAVATFRDDAVQILDVTDPDRPAPVGLIDDDGGRTHLNGARGIVTFEISGTNYAAVAAEFDHGVQIIDLSDPTNPTATDKIDKDDGDYELERPADLAVFVRDGKTYLAVAAEVADGVQILDVSDPTNISAAGEVEDKGSLELNDPLGIDTYTRGSFTYAVVAADQDDGIQMLNITDPDNPEALDRLENNANLELDGATGVVVFEISGFHYAAVAAYDDRGLQIVNVTDPTNIEGTDNITDSSSLELRGATEVATFTRSGSTYVVVASEGDDGVQIVDVSDPSNISAVGRLTNNNDHELNDPYGVAIYESGGNHYAVIASEEDDGVQIINVSTPSSPAAAGKIDDTLRLNTAAAATHFEVSGRHYAIVTSLGEGAIQILDITEPSRPFPVSSLSDNSGRSLNGALNVDIFTLPGSSRIYAGVTAYYEGVQIIDVTNPARPNPTDRITDNGSLFLNGTGTMDTFVISGTTYAIVSGSLDNGIQIIDVSDPSNISAAGQLADTANTHLEEADLVQTFTFENRPYASVITASGDLQLLNLTDPANPAALDENTDAGRYVTLHGSKLYTSFTIDSRQYGVSTSNYRTINVFDLTHPANPLQVGSITDTSDTLFNGTGSSTAYETGGKTYLAIAAFWDHGVQIFELEAPKIDYPTVRAGPDQSVNGGALVTLSGSGSDPAGHTLTYKWTHNSTLSITLADYTARSTTFTAPNVTGVEVVEFTLKGTNPHGYSDSDIMTVTITGNLPPIVDAGPDQIVAEGTLVTLDATASDPDNDLPLTILWTHYNTDHTAPTITLSSTSTLRTTFTAPQVTANTTYVFTLAVSDSRFGAATDEARITVYDVPSPAPIVNAGENQIVDEGDTVTLTGTAREPDGESMTYKWSCKGDSGSIRLGNTDSLSITFTAPDVGHSGASYTCTFTATDPHGSVGTDSLVLTVRNVPDDGPRMSMIGDTRPTVVVGSSYVDPGASCTTILDHSISLPVRTTGSVNTDSVGTYEIKYTCEHAGLSFTHTRIVKVIAASNDQDPKVIVTYKRGAIGSDALGVDYSSDAKCRDREDGDISHKITTSAKRMTNDRDYALITYSCTDSGGNTVTASQKVGIISGNSPPTISLHGGSFHINVGDSWSDPGATCRDAEDGTWTIKAFKNTIDTSTPGHYLMLYRCLDSDGDEQLNGGVRHVYVTNSDLPPVLTLSSYQTTISVNGTWSMPTATCMDKEDDDISHLVYTYGENSINVHKAGTYKMTFKCEDTAGNFVDKFFRVIVTE